MLKIGHRGAMGYEPQNTLRSFKKAIELGVDMVEFDIHKIKTGELIVIHDDKVNRTTNGKGYVKDFDFKKIKKLDAGRGEVIPTLDEVINLCLAGGIMMNIEIKGEDMAKDVVKVMAKRNLFDKVIISSFDYNQLIEVRRLDSKIPLGLLVEEVRLESYLDLAKDLGMEYINPNYFFIDKDFIKAIHQAGIKANVWTVNDPLDIKRMKEYGVDGIMSDFPDRL